MSRHPKKTNYTRATSYHAQCRIGTGWTSYYGTVRLAADGGDVSDPKEVCAYAENLIEAIRQWDPKGLYEWRIIERETTWTERVHSYHPPFPTEESR